MGGYTGTYADPTVLATTDGVKFTAVARLRVPVRYPAVASAAGKLFVFGGQAISGPQAGVPVNDIQEVDPTTHSAAVVAQLPEPLQASAAVEIRGNIYLAGGDTTTPQLTPSGVGSANLTVPSQATGSSKLFTTATIWAFDPTSRRTLIAGRLQVPVSHAGIAVVGDHAWVIGGESGGSQVGAVQMMTPNAAFGTAGAPGAGSPYFGGRLLIADRGNNRLLLLDSSDRVVWRFPSSSSGRDRIGFVYPDDAFFIHHGTAIISNQEQQDTIEELAFPSGKVIWAYGHPRQPGLDPIPLS